MNLIKIPKLSLSAPNFGWDPDPYSPFDLRHNELYSDAPTTGDIDNTKHFKDISQQSYLPSCTSQAGTDLKEAWEIFLLTLGGSDLLTAKSRIPDLSRMFPWYWGRSYMDPPRHKDATSGCHNRLILEAISRLGSPPEKYWPYDFKLATVRPSITAGAYAAQYADVRTAPDGSIIRRARFQKISHSDFLRHKFIERIIQTLHNSPGVMFGTDLTLTFYNVIDDKVIGPESKTRGRHAMLIVGWNEMKGAFKVRNSWGPDFGFGGYCWMSAEYIMWNKSRSFWTYTK